VTHTIGPDPTQPDLWMDATSMSNSAPNSMGGARIFAVWEQRGGRAKGIGGKTGHVQAYGI